MMEMYSAKYRGLNGRRWRLAHTALHALGLSAMQVETALGQHEQQGGGPGKARSSLCLKKHSPCLSVGLDPLDNAGSDEMP